TRRSARKCEAVAAQDVVRSVKGSARAWIASESNRFGPLASGRLVQEKWLRVACWQRLLRQAERSLSPRLWEENCSRSSGAGIATCCLWRPARAELMLRARSAAHSILNRERSWE